VNLFDKVEPKFHIDEKMEKLINEIELKIDKVIINDSKKRKYMIKKAMVRSVHSSLAIEENTISLFNTEKIYENKQVIGKKEEIQEVKNAFKAYSLLNELNYKSEDDFIKTHNILMKYLEDDNGFYRDHGEGVKRDEKIIYVAPNSILVPSLMNSLFEYLKTSNDNLLIKACVFHYYFVSIHPFTNGNGRLARLWVSLILNKYNKNFEYIPIEEEIYFNQEKYYNSISECHVNGNANSFIKFMLDVINSSLDKIIKNNIIKLTTTQEKIIELIMSDKYITQDRVTEYLNVNVRTVKRNFKVLIDNDLIERIGSDKTGYWEVK
jgi:Fic family protein